MKRPVYCYSGYKLALLFSGEISCGRLLYKAAMFVVSFSKDNKSELIIAKKNEDEVFLFVFSNIMPYGNIVSDI